MDLSVSSNPFKAESVKELKVSLQDAKAITKDNGLDEVFYKVGDKDYVAFGRDLDLKGATPGATLKIGNAQAVITHVDDEATGFWEGAWHGVKSTPGLIFEGGAFATGAVMGAALGTTGAVFGLNSIGQAVSRGGTMGLALGAAAALVPAAIGGVSGLFKGHSYDTINTISK